MPACSLCGGPGMAAARRSATHEESTFCWTCLAKFEPELEFGSFVRSLVAIRPRPGGCPYCGWTERRLAETGLLGCPLCYESIESPLLAGFAKDAGTLPGTSNVK